MNRRNGPHRIAIALAAIASSAALPHLASGATITDSVQPLGLVGNVAKPDCASPAAPWSTTDLAAIGASEEVSSQEAPLPGENDLIFAGLGLDLLPTATICSPTYQGFPGAFSGSVASRLLRARVGRGWREIGNTLAQPAPLRPGDRLVVPEVDDAAQLKVEITAAAGSPAAQVSFTDLAPGPSTVTVGRDQRGVVATLTRGDGTTADAIGAVPVVPAINASVSGTAKVWRLVTHHVPGTVVSASEFSDEDSGIGVSAADGRTVTTIKRSRVRRRARHYGVLLVTLNRTAMRFETNYCGISTDKRGRPRAVSCDPFGLSEFFRLATRESRSARRPGPVQAPHPSGTLASAARRAAAAPLDLRPATRSIQMVRGEYEGVVPLAADVNGDGQTDFWAEGNGFLDSLTSLGLSVGTILVSSPSGLQPHRVELAGATTNWLDDSSSVDSDISAIDDVTGDGLGEIVVDLGERHGLIPGDRDWASNTAAIIAPDPTDLDAGDYLLLPSSSSPGAPYAALDDVTGDGRRELAATDDYGTWQSIASSNLVPGRALHLASVARAVPAPSTVQATRFAEDTAPRFDPRTRVIAGQAVALSWPVVATRKVPDGKVTISIRDALGRDVVPPATATVPGNALLLDHDRKSGDTLLLAATPACLRRTRRGGIAKSCRQTVVRVRADGSTRQTLVLPRRLRDTTAPQTARFLGDGPDADGDVEILLTEDDASLSVVDSTLSGAVPASSFGHAEPAFLTERRVPYAGLRFIPVVAPDGARRVFVSLNSSNGDRREEAVPTEVIWK